MSIYRYGAAVEVIGAEYKNLSKINTLHAKVKLLELYDDGSGKVGDVLELPFNQLEVDGGLLEFATACERFTTLIEKELEMKTQINSIEGKSLAELTGIFNGLVPPSRQVKRFSDRDAAVARLTKELSGEANPVREKKRVKARAATKIPAAKKAPVAVKETVKGEGKNIKMSLKVTELPNSPGIVKLVGKKSSLSGKYLYKKIDKETGKAIANPRREGTHGWHSWNAIKDGMTYEQFIGAKGGNKHLMWDIDHGYVVALSKPRA
jgi:hypothetical protein